MLATLGGGSAVLTEQGIWHAVHEPIQVRSTVGAGDSSLSGFLIAHTRGEMPRLPWFQAVAHSSAAAALPSIYLRWSRPLTEVTVKCAALIQAVFRTSAFYSEGI